MTLTREFDFTGVTGRVELSYWTWYDIEEGWDYLYLESSLDGESWEILKTPSCSDDDLSGNAYGLRIHRQERRSARWTQESIDLSDFAGKTVQLRFEYVTDAALNGEGLLLDDLTIDAIGYSETSKRRGRLGEPRICPHRECPSANLPSGSRQDDERWHDGRISRGRR